MVKPSFVSVLGASACAVGFWLTASDACASADSGPVNDPHPARPTSQMKARPHPATAGMARTTRPAAARMARSSQPIDALSDLANTLGLAVRKLFFNQAPTVSTQGPGYRLPSGTIWDTIHGVDPEGDALVYTLERAPLHGTVSISDYGTYTYTPGVGFTGADTFLVGVDETQFHLNLFDLLGNRHGEVPVTVRSDAVTTGGVVVDDFGGAAGAQPSAGLWNYETGKGVGDGLQNYTDAAANVRLDGQGHLIIQARPTGGGYTSGLLTTKGKLDMMYGTLTARIKFPAGQGIWPAFWMLGSTFSRSTWNAPNEMGWPGCGEIDIMELANTATTFHVALHGPQGASDYYKGTSTPWQVVGTSGPVADLSADFHDYWVTREPDLIVIGVDDTVLGSFTPASLPSGARWVFNEPMFAILNIAVGGPWPGPPDATTPWPATMLVDWFRYTPAS